MPTGTSTAASATRCATCSATTSRPGASRSTCRIRSARARPTRPTRRRSCRSSRNTTTLREPRAAVTPAGARRGAPGQHQPEARRSHDARRASSRSSASTPRTSASPSASRRRSSCSRRSATCRAPRRTSCRRPSTTTSRWSTSKRSRSRRFANALRPIGRTSSTASGSGATRGLRPARIGLAAGLRRLRRYGWYTPAVPKLTVTVITRNEAANIDAALASVAWADEIIVVDSESTDDTAAIARRHTRAGRDQAVARLQRAEELRRVASPRTTGSCRSTPTSASRRRSRRRSRRCSRRSRRTRGYRVPRVSHYLGRWIRGTDWYPDYQLRLYDRRAGRVERPPRPRVGRA